MRANLKTFQPNCPENKLPSLPHKTQKKGSQMVPCLLKHFLRIICCFASKKAAWNANETQLEV